MCFPATPIAMTAAQSFGASMALSGITAFAQYNAAAASVRTANAAARANRDEAVASANTQYLSVAARQLQEDDAASAEIERIEDEGRRAESSAILAGIESGAGGVSLLERPNDFRASALRYGTAVTRSLAYKRSAAAGDLKSIHDRAAGRVTGFRPNYTQPSFLNAGLTMLGGFLDSQRFLAPGGGGGGMAANGPGGGAGLVLPPRGG